MRKNISNCLLGFVLILAGAVFAGNAMGWWQVSLFFQGWWTLFLIIPAISSMIRRGIHIGNSILLLIGVLLFFSAQSWIPFQILRRLMFPLILIFIGVGVLLHNIFAAGRNPEAPSMASVQSREFCAVFSGREETFPNGELFEGASCLSVFGGVDLDLRGVVLTYDVRIDATAIFGGVDLKLPEGYAVKTSCFPLFGGMDNHCKGAASLEGVPTIYVNATCIFGGVDLK